MDLILILKIVVLCIFLCFSAFFSGSETALFSLSRLDLKKLGGKNKKKNGISELMENPQSVLVNLLLGNLLVNIGASSLATAVSLDMLKMPETINFLNNTFGISKEWINISGLSFTVGIMTFLILIFGEITPKMYALNRNRQFSLFCIDKLKIFSKIFSFPIKILDSISGWLLGLILKKEDIAIPFISVEEWKKILHQSTNEGILEKDEKEMIYHIFKFGEIIAREIMVPRIDMKCISADMTLSECLKYMKESQYSRFPVYYENIDNIIGIVHMKEILRYLRKGTLDIKVKEITRKPLFVPETKKIDDILELLRKQKTQLAIVVDEYGGTEGLLTVEDIVEEVVGEIQDEYDTDEETIEKISESEWIIDAKTPIDTLIDDMGINIDDDEYDSETVGGFIIELIGEIPEIGKKVDFQNVEFEILEATNTKIDKIKVKIDKDSIPGEIDTNEDIIL
ncbi:HlyC/CorC family transporter [bacterium]|nr:HlyC/CorC family transporter [bacterium]